ncbi:hypothetical protein ACFP81_01855 [Deinococcus lacus]|uniref:Outer membrane protein beta-barrel domain-containing protein n=1 Tax=Deinococcus lacus TaxID=392561 RepID=A0ABW1YBW5_9DEIO
MTATVLASAASAQTYTQTAGQGAVRTSASPIELGLMGGYADGLNGEAFVHVPNVAGAFGVKAGVSYGQRDAIAKPTGAIVDITAGTNYKAEGSATVVSLDGTYGLGQVARGTTATAYAGGRYGMFGGKETYTLAGADYSNDFSANAFGLGAGVQISGPVSSNMDLVGDLGVDHFFAGEVKRTAKMGNTVLEEDTYTDAADIKYNRFNAPGTNFKAKVGVKFRL